MSARRQTIDIFITADVSTCVISTIWSKWELFFYLQTLRFFFKWLHSLTVLSIQNNKRNYDKYTNGKMLPYNLMTYSIILFFHPIQTLESQVTGVGQRCEAKWCMSGNNLIPICLLIYLWYFFIDWAVFVKLK